MAGGWEAGAAETGAAGLDGAAGRPGFPAGTAAATGTPGDFAGVTGAATGLTAGGEPPAGFDPIAASKPGAEIGFDGADEAGSPAGPAAGAGEGTDGGASGLKGFEGRVGVAVDATFGAEGLAGPGL